MSDLISTIVYNSLVTLGAAASKTVVTGAASKTREIIAALWDPAAPYNTYPGFVDGCRLNDNMFAFDLVDDPPIATLEKLAHVSDRTVSLFGDAARPLKKLFYIAIPFTVAFGSMWLYQAWLLRRIDSRSAAIESVTTRDPQQRDLMIDFKQRFATFPASPVHSHPHSAANRSAANAFLQRVVTEAGYEPYSVSMSNSDKVGSRLFYFAKDLSIPYHHDPLTDNHVLVFTDVDYYADMPHWLTKGRPTVLYTFCPTTMAGQTEEFAWRFVGDEVEYTVTGGSTYRHPLWFYDGDVVTVVDPKTLRLFVYNLEQRIVPGDPQHRFIYFTLAATVEPSTTEWGRYLYSCLGSLAWKFGVNLGGRLPTIYYGMDSALLKRRTFANGRMLFSPIDNTLSVATDESWQSVEIRADHFAAIKARLDNKNSPTFVGDVERMLSSMKDPEPSRNAPLLYTLLDKPMVRNVVPTSQVASVFDPIGSSATADSPSPGYSGATPLVSNPAMFSTRGVNADEASISGRIVKPRNNIKPNPTYNTWANEFVNLVVRQCGTGLPIDYAGVREHQAKQAQRVRFDENDWLLSVELPNELKCFLKVEPYAAANDPRNITTMDANCTIVLSAYTLPFKHNVLKRFTWYGPGQTPTETVQRLASITSHGAIGSDFSRFDGSVSEWLQKSIVYATYLRWASPGYRPHLKKALDLVFIQAARTSNGRKFNPGWGTRSGSPITTDGNTLINAFVSYAVYRTMGYASKTAFEQLGVYCGDDGLVPLTPGYQDKLEAVCKDLGLGVVAETHLVGPYPYLGRFFVDPCTTVNSFQDPMRTLGKLHLVKNGASREQMLTNKAAGYAVTDSNTPLIGTWCHKVLSITGATPKNLTGEEQFKMSQSWPYCLADAEATLDAFCVVVGVTRAELQVLEGLMASATSLDDFPVLFETEFKVKIPALVLGNVETPPGGVHIKQSPSTSNSTSSGKKNGKSPTQQGKGPSSSKREANGKGNPGPGKDAGRSSGKAPRANKQVSGGGRGNPVHQNKRTGNKTAPPPDPSTSPDPNRPSDQRASSDARKPSDAGGSV